MNLIEDLKLRASANKKTIVLPESYDKRILKAASIALTSNISNIILIGNRNKIIKDSNDMNIILDNVIIIDPYDSKLTDKFIEKLYNLRREKGMTLEKARELILNDNMYFACMLIKEGMADGCVSGAYNSTANTLRPALQIIKTKPGKSLVSAFFVMSVPDCIYGYEGNFIFADCGLEANPTPEKLAEIAADSAESFKLLFKAEPKVAFLSYSTMGSAKHDDVSKVVDAVRIAKEKYPDYAMDGELQLDAAIIPEIAKNKAPDSSVAGHANVLIFPDLDAGNIGYKLVQRLAHANAYGPICQGIAAPINDLSRGCSVDDIVGVICITAVQAQNIK